MLYGKAKAVMIASIGILLSFAALCGMMAVSYKNMERIHQNKADMAVLHLIPAERYEVIQFEKEGTYRMIRSAYLAMDQEQQPIGYIALLTVPAYNGLIEVDVAIAMDGESIVNIAVDAKNETEGLGAKASDKSFTGQFLEKKLPVAFTEVQAISGATVTSTAVVNAVNLAGEFTRDKLIANEEAKVNR